MSQKKLKLHLFPDDRNIYCDCDTLTNLAKMVNKGLKYVNRWFDINRISLNISKTNYIIFHTTTMKIPTDTPFQFGRKLLAKANYVRFLGLLSDDNLSWKFHISELSNKLARTCGIFYKIRSLVSTSTLILIYNSIFLPFLQYGIIVWEQIFPSYLEPSVLIQKRKLELLRISTLFPHFANLQEPQTFQAS